MSKPSNLDKKPRTYWKNVVSEFHASGLSKREFCAVNGIKCSSLHYWVYRKDLNLVRPENIPAFFPVKIDACVSNISPNSEIKISLRNGIILSVTKGFDVSTFRDLLEVLKT